MLSSVFAAVLACSRYLHIFEPYNEPDWTSFTATTWGQRRVSLAKALDANQANQANIGI